MIHLVNKRTGTTVSIPTEATPTNMAESLATGLKSGGKLGSVTPTCVEISYPDDSGDTSTVSFSGSVEAMKLVVAEARKQQVN